DKRLLLFGGRFFSGDRLLFRRFSGSGLCSLRRRNFCSFRFSGFGHSFSPFRFGGSFSSRARLLQPLGAAAFKDQSQNVKSLSLQPIVINETVKSLNFRALPELLGGRRHVIGLLKIDKAAVFRKVRLI